MSGSSATPSWFNFQSLFEASIPAISDEICRRPYHRNCSCALHRSRNISVDSPCPSSPSSFVSYPLRRRSSSWHSLASSSSVSNLVAAADGRNRCWLEDDGGGGGEEGNVIFAVGSSYQVSDTNL